MLSTSLQFLRKSQGASEYKTQKVMGWGSNPGTPMEVRNPLRFSMKLGVYVDIFIF